jgi:DNA processing protein
VTHSDERWELRLEDAEYPACLRDSPHPPKVVRGFGDPALLAPGLGVVGSRRATPYGLRCASDFAGRAGELGVTVMSGAAIGCDSAAHIAALDRGGATVAVLGCGADVDYPRSGSKLLARIRAEGAVMSEVPWGVEPQPFMFPARNRIIAALSAALLVVEAGLPSGTFSTADHAADAGRQVLAVPGSVFSPTSAGCNRLIRQGAAPITETSDLDDELVSAGLVLRPQAVPARAYVDPDTLDPVTRRLWHTLRADPMRPDSAALALDAPITAVLRALSSLEAGGLARRYPDGRYGPG